AEWPAIVELVRSTAGVALALEMLAARLRTLTPEMVLEMGKEVVTWRFPSGTKRVSAPHMSMLKTVAQSWNTCDPREQRLWARLSTFVGGFTVQATREVCFDEDVSVDEVLELLESLVLKSVVVPPSREGRYSQHAYLREYGQRMLNEQFDEVDELRERHSLWAARSARQAAATWFGPDEVGTLKANHADLH